MAREIFQLQSKDAIIRLNHYDHVNMVQNFQWDPAFNEEYISQLGDEAYAAQTIQPEVSGSFEQMATGSTVAFLKQMINTFNVTTGRFTGFLAGDPATADNSGTIDELDLEFCIFDLIEAKRPNDEFKRSLLLPRMFMSSIAWSADANGNASETYNFEGDLAEVYRDPYQDLFTFPVTQKVGSETTTVVLPSGYTWKLDSGAAGTDGDYMVLALFVNEEKIDDDGTNLTLATRDLTIEAAAGVTIADGARLTVIAYKYFTAGVSDPAWPTINHPTSARFVKGDKIDIWLVASGTVDIRNLADGNLNTYTSFLDADQFLRVQTCNVNVDLRREALRQIKKNNRGNTIYYRGSTYPLNITASASVLETDLWAWQKIQGKNDTDVLDLAAFENAKWQLVMRYYYNDSVIQTIAFTDARVSGRSYNVAVEGRAEVTWDFTGSELKIEGSVV